MHGRAKELQVGKVDVVEELVSEEGDRAEQVDLTNFFSLHHLLLHYAIFCVESF